MESVIYYLSGFNNYYNRQIKLPLTYRVEDYRPWIVQEAINTSWNPNDNITTSIDVNYIDIDDNTEIDYVLECQGSGDVVNTRWFVIDRSRNLSGQWRLSLKRDIISDNFQEVVNSPIYLEKATLTVSNPLIYNKENLTVNQIKTSETLLKDATGTPWIVIYFNRNQNEAKTIDTRADVIDNSDLEFSFEEMRQLEGRTLYGNVAGSPIASFVADYYNSAPGGGQVLGGKYTYFSDGTITTYTKVEGWNNLAKSRYVQVGRHPDSLSDTAEQWKSLVNANKTDVNNYIYVVNNTINENSTLEELKALAGKTIKDNDSNTYYTADITVGYEEVTFTVPENSGLFNALNNGIMGIGYIGGHSDPNNNVNTLKVTCNVAIARINNVEVVEGIPLKMVIPTSADRNNLTDAPWDMLAIPYNEVWVRASASGSVGTLPNVARAIAQAAYSDLGEFVADVQLLPYCPCMEYVSGNILNVSNLTNGVHYSPITTTDDTLPVSYGIWCNQSSFRVDIQGFTPITNPLDAIEFKVNNECDMYRLVSPNYTGAFEFTATKNGGILGFEANCTYKPFQPYIHINPIFGGLYGRDFNDNRGLVCVGNFSMASTGNNWTNYQIQNKAYKESFDRQIQNMETTYNIQREQHKKAAIYNAVAAGLSGAGSGAMLGGMAGPYGSLAGGALGSFGAALSYHGAMRDLEYADRLQKESLSYAQDKFDLSLQNIQALPNTMHNVGAFDINYKYYPFLEFYTCTETEKDALRAKLRYNGMTVNAIGVISDYNNGEDQFVQGQLIRYLGEADYHEVAEIAFELHKGVYI